MICSLAGEALDDGHAATGAKGLAGDAKPHSGLLAFPFIEINAALHPADHGFVETCGDDFLGGELLLDELLQNGIENVVGGEGILVFLIGA